jgi:hypothetical protein
MEASRTASRTNMRGETNEALTVALVVGAEIVAGVAGLAL